MLPTDSLVDRKGGAFVPITWAWDYLFYERAVRLIQPGETALGSGARQCVVCGDASHERNRVGHTGSSSQMPGA